MSPVTVCLFAFLLVFAPVYGRYRKWDVEEKRADVESAIAAVNSKLVDCMKTQNVDCLSEEYADDVILMPQGRTTMVGKADVLPYLQWISTVDEVTFTSHEVQAMDPDEKYVFERFDIHAVDENSKVLMEGKGLRIWRKDDNGYKIYINMFNSD